MNPMVGIIVVAMIFVAGCFIGSEISNLFSTNNRVVVKEVCGMKYAQKDKLRRFVCEGKFLRVEFNDGNPTVIVKNKEEKK